MICILLIRQIHLILRSSIFNIIMAIPAALFLFTLVPYPPSKTCIREFIVIFDITQTPPHEKLLQIFWWFFYKQSSGLISIGFRLLFLSPNPPMQARPRPFTLLKRRQKIKFYQKGIPAYQFYYYNGVAYNWYNTYFSWTRCGYLIKLSAVFKHKTGKYKTVDTKPAPTIIVILLFYIPLNHLTKFAPSIINGENYITGCSVLPLFFNDLQTYLFFYLGTGNLFLPTQFHGSIGTLLWRSCCSFSLIQFCIINGFKLISINHLKMMQKRKYYVKSARCPFNPTINYYWVAFFAG